MAHTPGPCELVTFDAPLDDWTGAQYVIRQPKHAPGGVAVIIGGAGGLDDALLVNAAPALLKACQDQHRAIDMLMARLIMLDKTFMPTESGPIWEAARKGYAAINAATGVTLQGVKGHDGEATR
jgi:hypothetical protein